jgi:hypothetical protein
MCPCLASGLILLIPSRGRIAHHLPEDWGFYIIPTSNPFRVSKFLVRLDIEKGRNAPPTRLCAVMRKLLHAIHGMLKHDKPFDNTRFYAIPASVG